MDALGDFFDRLSSVEWMADTGLPLLATLGGLWVAVILVGRQLDHDRTLRDADRLKQQLRVLTSELQASADRLRSEPTTSPYWRSEQWPDAPALAEAIRRTIPQQSTDARRQAVKVSASVAAAWKAIVDCRSELTSLSGRPNRPRRQSAAMRETLAPFALTLERLALSIDSWDGVGSQPLLRDDQIRSTRIPASEYAKEFASRLASGPDHQSAGAP